MEFPFIKRLRHRSFPVKIAKLEEHLFEEHLPTAASENLRSF